MLISTKTNIYFKILKLLLFIIIYKIYKNKNNNEIIIINQFTKLELKQIFNNYIKDSYQNIILNKGQLLKLLSTKVKNNISSVKSIYLNKKTNFENLIMIINNAIFFCEILQCKNLFVNSKYYWFINKKLKYKKYKIFIKKVDENDLKKSNLIIDKTFNLLILSLLLKTDLRINIIKKEILSNLPIVATYKSELYIYIKTTYPFKKPKDFYIHPPYCFYQTILNNFKFTNVKIISKIKNSPIINKIINEYKNITYEEIKFKYIISYLINAYNIVGDSSNFFNIIIRLNDKLLYFWEYDYLKGNNIYLNNRKIIIFRMFASEKYKDFLINSQDIFSYIYAMICFKCKNNFTIIKE